MYKKSKKGRQRVHSPIHLMREEKQGSYRKNIFDKIQRIYVLEEEMET